MEPGIEAVKITAEKTKAQIEDKNDNSSFTYSKPFPEVKAATSAWLGAASQILSKNKKNIDGNEDNLFHSAPQATSTVKYDDTESTIQAAKQVLQTAKIISRLELIEKALTSLQDSKQKTEDDIQEIKQWRDNLLTEQNNMALKAEQFCNQQKHNLESLRQEIREQDNKIMELNKEIESFKEKEAQSNKTLEKLSLKIKEYENNLNKINQEMELKTDSLTQEVRIHCSLVSSLQDQVQENMLHTTCNLNELYAKLENQVKDVLKLENQVKDVLKLENQVKDVLKLENQVKDVLKLENQVKDVLKLENQVKDVLKLENQVKDVLKLENQVKDVLKLENQVKNVLKLSTPLNTIKSPSCKPYICQLHVDNNTPVTTGSIISTFYNVWEPCGSHFNKTTGKLVAPEDGIYLVIATLLEIEDKLIQVNLLLGNVLCNEIFVNSAFTSACGSTVVSMKKGRELFFQVAQAEIGAKLQGGSGFTIVRL